MVAKTEKVTEEKENIVNDMNDSEEKKSIEVDEEEMDEQRLAELKARMAERKKATAGAPPKIVEEKRRSMRIGVIGSGQAGSRLAQCFHKLGYDSVAVNTAQQDLEHIDMPEANKLFLEYSLGGASKELSIGLEAAEMYRDAITELVHERLGNSHVLLFTTSLGGGSGAGSAEVIVDILASMGTPIVVMTVLPMSNDDAQTKANALQTLKTLADATQSKKIHNLIVVDNAKIESIYNDVNQLDFFNVSNRAIVEPIDVFNTLSSQASSVKALDPMEFAKMFTDGQGLTVYGQMTVANYEDETAIAEAVIENLDGNLLSGGFDLKQARYVGAMIVAPRRVWDKVPAGSVNYAMAMVNDICGTPQGVFKGIYEVDSDEDVVKVYSMFSGLGLPADRIEQLKRDAKELTDKNKVKDADRNLSLKLDTGVEESVSATEKLKQKIKNKSSAFGKLTQNVVKDRRK